MNVLKPHFASLAEFARDLNQQRTTARLSSARARGKIGVRSRGFIKQELKRQAQLKGFTSIVS